MKNQVKIYYKLHSHILKVWKYKNFVGKVLLSKAAIKFIKILNEFIKVSVSVFKGDRERERQTDRQIDRQTDRQRQRQRDRERQRQRETERDRDRERVNLCNNNNFFFTLQHFLLRFFEKKK